MFTYISVNRTKAFTINMITLQKTIYTHTYTHPHYTHTHTNWSPNNIWYLIPMSIVIHDLQVSLDTFDTMSIVIPDSAGQPLHNSLFDTQVHCYVRLCRSAHMLFNILHLTLGAEGRSVLPIEILSEGHNDLLSKNLWVKQLKLGFTTLK